MPAGLKRAAKVKTPPAVREKCWAKCKLADRTEGTAVARARAAAAGRCGLSAAWTAGTACFLTALVSVVKLLPFHTIGLDQVNHRL